MLTIKRKCYWWNCWWHQIWRQIDNKFTIPGLRKYGKKLNLPEYKIEKDINEHFKAKQHHWQCACSRKDII